MHSWSRCGLCHHRAKLDKRSSQVSTFPKLSTTNLQPDIFTCTQKGFLHLISSASSPSSPSYPLREISLPSVFSQLRRTPRPFSAFLLLTQLKHTPNIQSLSDFLWYLILFKCHIVRIIQCPLSNNASYPIIRHQLNTCRFFPEKPILPDMSPLLSFIFHGFKICTSKQNPGDGSHTRPQFGVACPNSQAIAVSSIDGIWRQWVVLCFHRNSDNMLFILQSKANTATNVNTTMFNKKRPAKQLKGDRKFISYITTYT